MMRVCYLNHTLRGETGAGRFGRSLLRALAAAIPGLETIILTAEDSGAAGELAILPAGRAGFFAALPRLRRVFAGCDIIHALDGYPFGVLAALGSAGLNRKLVITAIGTGALQPLDRPIAGRFLRWAYRRADRVVAVSRYTARELEREMPALKIAAVINHGVDAEEFSRLETAKLEIEKLRPYILSVGALKPRKGYRYSLAAFAEIRKSHPGLRYVIVGDGPEREGLESWISDHGLGGAVRFLPHVGRDFLISLYRGAELFLLLPYDADRDVEGFGLVFLEAAAAGIPVIGTEASGAADAVADRGNGFLVPPQDPSAAAGAMARILGDAELRRRLAAGSRRLAAEMGWERVALAYRELYAELLGRPDFSTVAGLGGGG